MVLITGASGFVGNKLLNALEDAVAAPSLRGASEDEVARIVENSHADIIIHTAAIADMGDCENNPEESYNANVLLPVYLAKACKNKKLICFSSDQVYNGCKESGPYTENIASPSNVYARHKLEMEEKVLDILPSAVLLRAEWMYDVFSKKGNYFLNLLAASNSISYSSSQYRGLTYLKEVALNIDKVIKLPGGIYNFGSETEKSMYEITKQLVDTMNLNIDVIDSPARHNLWMDCTKIKEYGINFSDTLEGLISCYNDYIIAQKES